MADLEPVAWVGALKRHPLPVTPLCATSAPCEYYRFFLQGDYWMGTDFEDMTYPLQPFTAAELESGAECGLCHTHLTEGNQNV